MVLHDSLARVSERQPTLPSRTLVLCFRFAGAGGTWLGGTLRCILHRPDDPMIFCRDLLDCSVEARGGAAAPYDPACAPRLLKVCCFTLTVEFQYFTSERKMCDNSNFPSRLYFARKQGKYSISLSGMSCSNRKTTMFQDMK